jgi:hypothetical protein
MAHFLSCISRRLPAALPAALAALQQHTAGLVLQSSAAAAAVDAQQHLLQDRLRSNHTASCSHSGSQHSHNHQHGGSSSAASSSFEEQEATCWSCHDRFHRGGLVCQACDKIQPSDPSLTHYDILG